MTGEYWQDARAGSSWSVFRRAREVGVLADSIKPDNVLCEFRAWISVLETYLALLDLRRFNTLGGVQSFWSRRNREGIWYLYLAVTRT